MTVDQNRIAVVSVLSLHALVIRHSLVLVLEGRREGGGRGSSAEPSLRHAALEAVLVRQWFGSSAWGAVLWRQRLGGSGLEAVLWEQCFGSSAWGTVLSAPGRGISSRYC